MTHEKLRMVAVDPLPQKDVAKSILFLASEDSSFMTGTPLIIDGVRMAH